MTRFEAYISVKEIGNRNKSYDLQTDLDGEVTLKDFLDFTKRTLQTVAIDALKEEQARGFDKKPIVAVDGSVNKSIANVNPLGKIEFISSSTTSYKIIEDIYIEILAASKIDTGTYISGNYVFHNGVRVATTLSELRQWIKSAPQVKPNDIIRYVNVVPYARRIERLGVTAGRTRQKYVKSKDKQKRSGEYILGANGPYFLASRRAIRDYKYNGKVSFRYILGSTLGLSNLPGIAKDGSPLRKGYKPSKKNSKAGPYLYPSIQLNILPGGTA